MIMSKYLTWLLICVFLSISSDVFAEEVPFTLEDRDRLIRIEVKLEDMDKRFEQVDKRFVELREDMNKRFEQVDKRFEFMQNLMIGILVVFGSLCGVFVGLLLWDRKTFKEKAKEEAVKVVEEGRVKDILASLREFANIEPKLKEEDINEARYIWGKGVKKQIKILEES